MIWQNILEEALDFQGSKNQILASFFFALSIISDFFLYVTSLEIMSNCVLYSYKLHSSSRTLLQDDDDFFFAKKSVVGKTLFPNFTSILSCSIIFA